MRSIKVEPRQTLADIALITCGSLEGLMALAEANGLSITDTPAAGAELLVPDAEYGGAAARVAVRYQAERIRPATEPSAEELRECPYGGIGLMGVEIDFEVS